MSESMVERVARAIAVAQVCGLDFKDGQRSLCTDPRVGVDQRVVSDCDCMRSARAAIEAMREPTEAMENAARDWSAAKYGKPIGKDASNGCWQCQINAALKD
jgi:hypothetical protein